MKVWDDTEAAAAEAHAVELFRDFVESNREALQPAAHFGDGRCGHYIALLVQAMDVRPSERSRADGKARIPAALARQVMERDAYRCRHCGTWLDLTCDHVVAESRGGATALENLQTLCRPCNSRKGAR